MSTRGHDDFRATKVAAGDYVMAVGWSSKRAWEPCEVIRAVDGGGYLDLRAVLPPLPGNRREWRAPLSEIVILSNKNLVLPRRDP